MPLVYVKCPVTGYLISTNHIVADQSTLEHRADRHIPIECPYCHGEHIWDGTNGLFLSIADNQPTERFGKSSISESE